MLCYNVNECGKERKIAMNLVELILYIIIYYGFVYLSIPYALGEKFANLFPNKKHRIRKYIADSVDDFSTWQKWIRWLAVPGLLIGVVIRKLVEVLAYLISPGKYSKLIWMSILIPFVLAAALFGIEQLYVLGMNALTGEWARLVEQCPDGSFIPFALMAMIAQEVGAGSFNLFIELLKLLCVLPLNLLYFAIIFGLFEGTTVSLWQEDYEDDDDDDEAVGNNLLKKCVNSVTNFFKQTRIGFTCRIHPDEDDLSGETIQDCCYEPMCKRIFIPSVIVLFIIMFIFTCISGQVKSFFETMWTLAVASGLIQAIISFVFTALASLLTHKGYEHLPEGVRDFIDEKLSDAVGSVIESNLFSIDTVLNTHGGPKNPPPSGNSTNYFG